MAGFIVFISLALLFYSWAVWGAYIERELCALFVWLFMAGFVCDLIGTSLMAARTPEFHLTIHTLLGIMALLIMAAHGAWACQALYRPQASELFHRWSVWAYILWMIAFVTGGILHWAGR